MNPSELSSLSVAVDDGPNHDLRVGNRVIWRHTQRGGYCFTLHVPVTIRKVSAKCVWVEPDGYSGRIVRVPIRCIFQNELEDR